MFYSILKILCFFSSFLLCSSVVDESVAFNVDNGASHVDLLMEIVWISKFYKFPLNLLLNSVSHTTTSRHGRNSIWSILKDWVVITFCCTVHASVSHFQGCFEIFHPLVVGCLVMRIALVLIVRWVEHRRFFSCSMGIHWFFSWCSIGYQALLDDGGLFCEFVAKLSHARLESTISWC